MSFVFQAADYPASPGCYIMKDAAGRILYVGKSKNVRSRLRSYFTKNHPQRKIRQLVGEIAAIEAVLVNNEAESLLLENNLIKIHKPPYNRALKRDNSGYAYLQLTSERFPRLSVYYRDRRPADGKSSHTSAAERRFGPYQNMRFRDVLLEFVTEHYGLRTCETMPKRACLLYHIGKCSGICEGKISEAEYRGRAEQAAELLASGGRELLGVMYAKMEAYAERLEFERAEHMLRYIRLLERKPDKQIVDRESAADQDVLYFGEDRVLVAKVQEGMLRDFQMHELTAAYGELACDSFLIAHYGEQRPDELIINKIADPRKVHAALRVRGSKPVKITLPKRGLKRDLLELCRSNYEYRMSRERKA